MSSYREQESEAQVRSRVANESTARTDAGAPTAGRTSSFRCECGDRNCGCAIVLTLAEYEAVRAYDTHFAIARNHENPEREGLIEEHERFAVVETISGEAVKLARRTGRGSSIGGNTGPGYEDPPSRHQVAGGGGSSARFARAAEGIELLNGHWHESPGAPEHAHLSGVRHGRVRHRRRGPPGRRALPPGLRPKAAGPGVSRGPVERRAWALLAVPVQVALYIDHMVNRPSRTRPVPPARLTFVGPVARRPPEGHV